MGKQVAVGDADTEGIRGTLREARDRDVTWVYRPRAAAEFPGKEYLSFEELYRNNRQFLRKIDHYASDWNPLLLNCVHWISKHSHKSKLE